MSLIKKHAPFFILLASCAAIALAMSAASPVFATVRNVRNILEASSYRMIMAVGMTFVIASGAIDLSVGSILTLTSIVMASAMRAGAHPYAAAAGALALGAALGAANGVLILAMRLHPIIITLSTSFIWRGLSLIITRGAPITKLPEAFRALGSGDLFGAESGVTIAACVLISAFPIMYSTRWGQWARALGGNERALLRAGAPVGRMRVETFALMGALAALAGVIVTARLNSAEPNAGLDMEIYAIASTVMGGTPMSGGVAELAGTGIAVIMINMINNALTLLSVSSYYRQFITGAMMLLAVGAFEMRSRGRRR